YPLPLDSSYARAHMGAQVSCRTATGYSMSAECGCGTGLERCMPGGAVGFDPTAMAFPTHTPLGFDAPLDQTQQAQSAWIRYWWGQETLHFLDDVIVNDRDFRDVLTAHDTFVNGPLAQFYRNIAPATCCGNGTSF